MDKLTAITPIDIYRLWNSNQQIRQAFKTLGTFQDYVLNPQISPIQLVENSHGKIDIIESSFKQKIAPNMQKPQEPQKPRSIENPFKEWEKKR